MDTTSSNFTWQTFTFGGNAGSCVLNDVAIINDTLAYAVGAIYLKDSLGNPDPNAYNLVKWDGHSWQLLRIQFYTVRGNSSRTSYPTSSILAVNDSNIWIAMDGDQVARWNGKEQTDVAFLPNSFSIKKLWGENSNSIYAVGDNGNIIHYINGVWQKIESGTSLDIRDIWGATDPATGKQQILAIASNDISRMLLQIQGTSVVDLSVSGLADDVEGIWFVPGKKYYIAGAGIHYKHSLGNTIWNSYPPGIVTSYLSGGIRGSDINDVFVVGSFFEIVHFNGSSWRNYRDVIPFNNGAVGRLAIKGNLVITVGLSGQKAIAIVGKRN